MQINVNLNGRVQALLMAFGLFSFGWLAAEKVDPDQFSMLNAFLIILSFASACGVIGCLLYAIVSHLEMTDTKDRRERH